MRMELLGQQIRLLRLKRGLSENETARRLGVSDETYRRTESGNRNIPMKDIYRLAEIFDVPYSMITDISDENILENVPKEHQDTVRKVYQMLDVLAAQETLHLCFSADSNNTERRG